MNLSQRHSIMRTRYVLVLKMNLSQRHSIMHTHRVFDISTRRTTTFLHDRGISDGYGIVSSNLSNLPRGDMRIRPRCARVPDARNVVTRGGAISVNPARVKETPPLARPFGAGRGGFLCPWPNNNGDRVNANYPHGCVT